MARLIAGTIEFLNHNRKTTAAVVLGAGAVALSLYLPGAPFYIASAFFAGKVSAFVGSAYVGAVSASLAVAAIFGSVAAVAGLTFKAIGSLFCRLFTSNKKNASDVSKEIVELEAVEEVAEESRAKSPVVEVAQEQQPVVYSSPLAAQEAPQDSLSSDEAVVVPKAA